MPPAVARFGPFLVDRASYRVTRNGDAVALTPKLLDLLLYLVDRPATLVTKEELLDALWPGANVTENALTQAVSELRQALGDSASQPRYIKTIARRGYRFIGELTEEDRPAPPPVSTEAAASPTIVVPDFHNVSGDPEYGWLAAGVAETVTGDLRALGRFRVVDRWRVAEAAARTDGSLQQTAAAVGASLAVVGSFQRMGDRIRITARVVDVPRGEALADAKADGPLTDLFDLQDRIVAGFARELGLPSPDMPRAAPPRETPRLDAYRAFTEGTVRLESFDTRELPRAITAFERAVALDPRYAAAYAGLANAECASYEATRFELEPSLDVLERAIGHARQAVALDEGLADAHGALALALGSAARLSEAVEAAERAVQLEPLGWRHHFRLCRVLWGERRRRAGERTLALYPEFALSYFQMAMPHIACGRLADAEALLRLGAGVQDQQIARGERLPGRGLHWLLGLVRLARGDRDDAIAEFDRELRMTDLHHLHGREFAVRAYLGRGLALAGDRAQEAVQACRGALAIYPRHPESHLALARALNASDRGEAQRAVAAAEDALPALERTRPVEAAVVRAAACLARERRDDAVAALDPVRTASPGAAWWLPIEPLVASLRGHPGFDALVADIAARGHG